MKSLRLKIKKFIGPIYVLIMGCIDLGGVHTLSVIDLRPIG